MEDDEDVLAIAAESLRELGYQVVIAGNAKQGMEILRGEKQEGFGPAEVIGRAGGWRTGGPGDRDGYPEDRSSSRDRQCDRGQDRCYDASKLTNSREWGFG